MTSGMSGLYPTHLSINCNTTPTSESQLPFAMSTLCPQTAGAAEETCWPWLLWTNLGYAPFGSWSLYQRKCHLFLPLQNIKSQQLNIILTTDRRFYWPTMLPSLSTQWKNTEPVSTESQTPIKMANEKCLLKSTGDQTFGKTQYV